MIRPFNCEFIIIPRNLHDSTIFIVSPFIFRISLKHGFFFLGLKKIKLVFCTFNDSLFAFNQFTTFSNSLFMTLIKLSEFFPLKKILVSSANNNGNNIVDTLDRSLM